MTSNNVVLVDVFGLELSTKHSDVPDLINQYYEEVLRYGNRWNIILKALHLDSNNAFIHLLVCDYHLAKENMDRVFEHLKLAVSFADSASCNAREKLYVQAYQTWLQEGDTAKSLEVFEKIVESYPADLFAVKRGQLLAFLLKNTEKMHSICQKTFQLCFGPSALIPSEIKSSGHSSANTKHSINGYLYAMYAFGLQEHGLMNEAEDMVHKALEVLPHDAWSQHTAAHILYFKGKFAEGAEFLQTHQQDWITNMSFMYTHNYFHLALFHIALGDITAALNVLDDYLWPQKGHVVKWHSSAAKGKSSSSFSSSAADHKRHQNHHHVIDDINADVDFEMFPMNDKHYGQDQLSAMNMLWKCELRGADCGTRWKDLARFVQIRPYGALFALLTLHTMRRAGCDDKADEIVKTWSGDKNAVQDETKADIKTNVASVSLSSTSSAAEVSDMTAETTISLLIRGVDAMERKEDEKAYELLSRGMQSAVWDAAVGGSHEQQEILHEVYACVMHRCGDVDQAIQYVKKHNLTLALK